MKKSFLKALSVVLSLLLTVSVFSSCNSEKEVKPVIEEKYSKPLYYVEDGTFGYNIYEDHAEVKNFFGADTLEVTIPSEIEDAKAGTKKPVTVIGKGSFNADTGAQILNISDTVTEIRKGAFRDCTGIEIVNFGKNVKRIDTEAFYNCMAIRELNLSDSVESIGKSAFYGCSTLEKLDLLNVRDIGDNAFEKCISLNEISGGDKLNIVGKDALSDTPWFASQTSEFAALGKVLIKYNGSSNEINLDDKIESVGNAFAGNENITKINMPSVKFICNEAFSGCTSLSDVTISEDAEFVGCSAFEGTPYLSSLSPDNEGFLKIGKVLVKYTGNSASVQIPDDVKMISDAFAENSALTEIITGNSLEKIGKNAFFNCTALENVVIGEKVKYIDPAAFEDCHISSFNVGKNVYAAYWASSIGLSPIYDE